MSAPKGEFEEVQGRMARAGIAMVCGDEIYLAPLDNLNKPIAVGHIDAIRSQRNGVNFTFTIEGVEYPVDMRKTELYYHIR
jgi:hypothetical protein